MNNGRHSRQNAASNSQEESNEILRTQRSWYKSVTGVLTILSFLFAVVPATCVYAIEAVGVDVSPLPPGLVALLIVVFCLFALAYMISEAGIDSGNRGP